MQVSGIGENLILSNNNETAVIPLSDAPFICENDEGNLLIEAGDYNVEFETDDGAGEVLEQIANTLHQ